MSDDVPRSPPHSACGPDHDAWLREALRHAPDASASPPPTLRDAILAEARAAARTAAMPRAAPAPSPLDRLLAFWSWLARPPVAAGFASVMAATLVGMLWWDRPMDETMLPPPSSPQVSMAPKPSPAPAAELRDAAPAAAPAPAPAKTVSPRGSTETTATSSTPQPDATNSARQQAARESAEAGRRRLAPTPVTAEDATAERKQAGDRLATTPPPAPAPAEAPAPFPAQAAREADAERRQATPLSAPRTAAAPLASTSPAPPPAPTVAAVPPQPVTSAPSRSEPFALAKKAEQATEDDVTVRARASPTAPAPATQPPTALPPAAGALGAALDRSEAGTAGRAAAQNAAEPTARRPAPLTTAAQPMAPLLASLASEDARWTRRLSSGESVAVDAAARAWLAEVQAAAARWTAAADRDSRRDAPAAALPAAGLRLDRDGRAGASVQIEDGGVRFAPASGGAWFAPLPPDVVARLRATLPR